MQALVTTRATGAAEAGGRHRNAAGVASAGSVDAGSGRQARTGAEERGGVR